MRHSYEALFEPDGEFFTIVVPDIPEITTFGYGLQDTIDMAVDALETMLLAYQDSGQPVPKPTYGRTAPKGGHVAIISVEPRNKEPELVTTKEAAEILGVSDARIRAMIRDGVLSSRKTSAGHLIPLELLKHRQFFPVGPGRPAREKIVASSRH